MSQEIHRISDLDRYLDAPRSLAHVICQGIDLGSVEKRLSELDPRGATFLGCTMSAALHCHLTAGGALVFPRIPDLPYRPYRAQLYTFDELASGFDAARPESFFTDTVDAAIYRHAQATRNAQPPPLLETLAQRLHDHAIDDALGELLEGHQVVAIMGGHAMTRDQPAYRAVVEIARGLTRGGRFIATGGGPGAMEAGNLGAWLATAPDEALEHCLKWLARAPMPQHPGYVARALEARTRFPDGAPSLAIPTWFYGHEPSNAFASHIAKYFANSIREDGLLAIAKYGVVYAPGSAGTVQEVFMDACQNHYGAFGAISPMVFFGRRFWTETQPVYPLLERLASGRRYASLLAIEDRPRAIIDLLLRQEPLPSQAPS